jgi:opacity protein-like surface antigen
MKKLLFGALLVTFVAATPARAQDEKLMHVNIGGGFTVPVSSIGDEFSTGGAFNLGLSIDPSPMFGFQVEYSYNDLSGQDRQVLLSATPILADVTNGIISSHHTMHYIDFNGTVRPKGTSLIKPYGVGGVGAYYRSVSLTTPDVGFTTICDPYWYVCYPTAVSVDRIIGDRHSWDPGINLGGGVTVAIGESAQFYVETRWHYVWGPSTTNPVTNETLKANAQYFPVTFGFRF